MANVFISYAREDRDAARQLRDRIAARGVSVFWDVDFESGVQFSSLVEDLIESAACTVVLWSKQSRRATWVLSEATTALKRRNLVQATLDMTDPPPPFNALNWNTLRGWKRRTDEVFGPFVNEVLVRVEADTPTAREYSLAPPIASGQVTDSHLALIHTCHRSKWFDAWFDGAETYRWDIAVYGSKRTLDRIEQVTYYLHPAYERDDGNKPSSAVVNISGKQGRHNCFLLKQIRTVTRWCVRKSEFATRLIRFS